MKTSKAIRDALRAINRIPKIRRNGQYDLLFQGIIMGKEELEDDPTDSSDLDSDSEDTDIPEEDVSWPWETGSK